MNKLSILLFISLIFIGLSCDKIDAPYTTIGNNNNLTNDTVRKVLLEDFTAHKCNNCPSAHKVASDLQKLYGKQLIVVYLHTTGQAKPDTFPFNHDYRCAEGNSLLSYFGVLGIPVGMINRIKQNNGGYLVDKGGFATEVSKLIDSLPKEPELYIHLDPSFNNSDTILSLNTEVTFLKSMPSGKYNLCIMITESGMISGQLNLDASIGNTPAILDYEHKHVLRGMVSPTFGDEILDGTPV
ncbi:MAG: Omp28-related outer membrane protein, partial [Bacteroidales bacterium]|nr:Omp28-related outer membrane protein [Bacteroidales bacterium]